MKKLNSLLIICLVIDILVSGCGSSQPTQIATSIEIPTQTLAPAQEEDLGSSFTVWQGGYSFEAPYQTNVSIKGADVILNSTTESLFFSLNGRWDIPSDLEATSILETLLSSVFNSEQSKIEKSEPIPLEINGAEGIAYDFSGTFSSTPVKGRAFVVKPSQYQYVFMLGMATTEEPEGLWQTSGSQMFDAIANSITIIPEEQLADAKICPIATDSTYGYTQENPIRVGGGLMFGLPRELAYLDNLLGPNGEEITYERLGSVQSPDTILDKYKLTYGLTEFILLLDEYLYEEPKAPQGLRCLGAFPISEP